jgi:hypothetical protein
MLYTVEIKANIDGAVLDALARLGDLSGATKRQIWFAEDRDGLAGGELRLYSADVIVRVRSGEGPDDTTAKLRPCHQSQLHGRWKAAFENPDVEYRIEGDWSGEHHVQAASAVSTFGQGTQAQIGGTGLHEQTLTSSQLEFLTRCASVSVSVDNLIALGPIDSTKWSGVAMEGLTVNAERWKVADLDFLELSIRVKPEKHDTADDFAHHARRQQRRLAEAVAALGMQVAANTDNKTHRVLTALAAAVHH